MGLRLLVNTGITELDPEFVREFNDREESKKQERKLYDEGRLDRVMCKEAWPISLTEAGVSFEAIAITEHLLRKDGVLILPGPFYSDTSVDSRKVSNALGLVLEKPKKVMFAESHLEMREGELFLKSPAITVLEKITGGKVASGFTFAGTLNENGYANTSCNASNFHALLKEVSTAYDTFIKDVCIPELASPSMEALFAELHRKNDKFGCSGCANPENLVRVFGEKVLAMLESHHDEILRKYAPPSRSGW